MAQNKPHDIVDLINYVWLDASLRSRGTSQTTATKIQKIAKGCLQTFNEPDACIDYITNQPSKEKINLIITNKLGKDVVPLIYQLQQIAAIYVYCGDQKAAESWATSDLKVRKIFTKEKQLLRQIFQDVRGPSTGDDNALPITAFRLLEQGHSLQKLSLESANFMWYQVAMNVLQLMANHLDSKQELIDEARKQYHTDETETKKIDIFAVEYQSTQACWWYTLNSFIYRLLNRALRTQDIDIIFKFRFFINDLHNQIQDLYRQYLTTHTGGRLTVYRGQFMSMDEIKFLERNIHQIVSMNTFLSTSQKRDVAEMFFDVLGQSNESQTLESVLFTIDITDISSDTTAFAFIEQHTCNPDESEVLFTINAIFRVESVKQDGRIWNVHLQLSKQQNEEQKKFSEYMIQAIGSEPGPVSFGWFLFRMGKFDKAERYAQYIIERPFLDKKDEADAYNLLGLIYTDLRKYEKSIECYEKAIEIYDQSDRLGSPQTIAIHYNLTLAYLANEDNRLAEDHRRRVDELLANSPVASDPIFIAMSDKLAGKLAAAHGNHAKAIENLKAALQEQRKALLPNHPSIATLLHNIGVIYAKMGDDTKALDYFQEAIKIGENSLSAGHFDLAAYHADIARIRYKHQEYQLALEQFQKALKIITVATRDENDTITELLKCIKDTNDKLDPLPTIRRK